MTAPAISSGDSMRSGRTWPTPQAARLSVEDLVPERAAALAGRLVSGNSMFAFLAAHRAEVFPDADYADLFTAQMLTGTFQPGPESVARCPGCAASCRPKAIAFSPMATPR